MKILIITGRNQDCNKLFINEIQKKDNIFIELANFSDIIVNFLNKNVKIYIKEKNLKEFDLIYIRIINKQHELQKLISFYCRNHNIKLIDETLYKNNSWLASKAVDYYQLSEHNLPIIDSYFVNKNNFSSILKKIKYPIILKIGGTSRGSGVFLCKNTKKSLETLKNNKKNMLIQPYIKNDGDFRLFIIDQKCVAAIKRTTFKKNEYRNNIALGAKAKKYKPTQFEKNIAIKAAKVLGYNIAGVDLIKNKEGKTYIMEVNRSPQFEGLMEATGINITKLIINYLIKKAKK